ncbi:MAG: hypothetical protein Q4A41_06375 [Bacillota bacterium]|nr:hypothetical protein [Bacillota bacterium]
MEKLIATLTELFFTDENQAEQLKEFGLEASDVPKMIEMFRDYFQKRMEKHSELYLRTDDNVVSGYEEIIKEIEKIDKRDLPKQILIGDRDTVNRNPFQMEENIEIWSRDGWNRVHEIIHEIPVPEKGSTYSYVFRIKNYGNILSYGSMFLYALMAKRDLKEFDINCLVHESTDGENHLTVMANSAAK